MIRRILLAIGYDVFSGSAISRGVELAKAHGAELTAVTIVDRDVWKGRWDSVVSAAEVSRRTAGRPWEAVQEHLDDLGEMFAHACQQAGVPNRLIHAEHEPLQQLVSESRYHDLLLFGLRGLYERTMVPDPEGTIAWLIRQNVAPIVAVSSDCRTIRRVMIAYNGSTQSADCMKRFVQLRLWPEAEHLVVAFEHEPEESDELLERAQAYCNAHGVKAEGVKGYGAARRGLLPLAQQMECDLLVLADSYRSLLLHQVLGDTMRDVVRRADRPLFLTH